jgi:hypothetical protein
LPMVVQVGCGRSCISTLAEAIMPPPRYPSDLSDREWAILESRCCLVRRKAWSPAKMAPEARGGRRLLPAARERVFVADAAPRVPTLADRLLPLARKCGGSTAGCAEPTTGFARRCARWRVANRDPSAAVIDSRVVKTTPVGRPERGYDDGAKRLSGRKRHILVDTGGLVLAARVLHGADLPDRDGGGRRLLEEGKGLPRIELVWADGAYTGGFREWLWRRLGWRWKCPTTRTGSSGATGWRKSRAASSRCWLAVGS